MTVAPPAEATDTEDLQIAVERALWEYDQVRGALSELRAEAMPDGKVEISGHVRSGLIKDGVLATLRRVPGVSEIVDRLYSDQELEVAVAWALAEVKKLPPGAVSIHGHLGQITLLGRLPDESLRSPVVEAAGSVPGVDRIVDRLHSGADGKNG